MHQRDRDNWNAPPPSTQTARALPTHSVRPGATTPNAKPSKTANVEGPIVPGTFVTQRFERNEEGEMFERKVDADLIVLLDAIVESKGYTAKIRVDVFDAIWARYDAGDYGAGRAGLAVYDDIDSVPKVCVVDDDINAHPGKPAGSTRGPQKIQIVPER